ncbi:MAG: endonuclease [Acidobacteria bacterium]|nr:MAG: endonuclease [Acidobacteriota bacterium]
MTKGLEQNGKSNTQIRYTYDMATQPALAEKIRQIFRMLDASLGQQHWWPAGSAFEVVVGAYLTQNTTWANVERAIGNLREAGVLSVSGIRDTPAAELEGMLRPAGYFRQKAARLKQFVAYLDSKYAGSLDALFARPTEALRDELLGLPGIGPETADSILLYAANREVFVVDAYTRRVFERHGLTEADARYDDIRLRVQEALAGETEGFYAGNTPATARAVSGSANPLKPKEGLNGPPADETTISAVGVVPHAPSAASQMERSELSRRYNEFHAQIVQTAKHFCVKTTPKCDHCPLRTLLKPESRS